MSTVDEQVQQLRDAHAAATRARIRAEHERDAAQARVAQATAALHSEFGIKDLAHARAVLADLQARLDAALAETASALATAEGGTP